MEMTLPRRATFGTAVSRAVAGAVVDEFDMDESSSVGEGDGIVE